MTDEEIIEMIKKGKMSITDVLFQIFTKENKETVKYSWFNQHQLNLIKSAFKLIDAATIKHE